MKFAGDLQQKFKAKIPKGYVVRLPTEAEWEYALTASCKDKNDVYIQFRDGVFGPRDEMASTIMVTPKDAALFLPEDQHGIMERWKYLCPIALHKPNSWGIYDLLSNGGDLTLDCVCASFDQNNPFLLPSLSDLVAYDEKEIDPLRYEIGGNACILRGAKHRTPHEGDWFSHEGCNVNEPKFSSRSFHLVIGPDLVSEWKAKNGKK